MSFKKDQGEFKAYLSQLETLKKKDFDSFNSNQKLSFWINAYNFFMVTTILEMGFKNKKLNINSVKDFGSFFNLYKIFKKEIIL